MHSLKKGCNFRENYVNAETVCNRMKTIALHIMDVLQNSIKVKSTLIELDILENKSADELVVVFKDNGCGMSEEMIKKVTNPFFTTRTERRVGLGLPLLKQNAEMTGGCLKIESEVGVGTVVTSVFGLSHIDRPPMGDIAGVVALTVAANPEIEFIFSYKVDDKSYLFDTRDVKVALDGLPINNPQVIQFMKEMIDENISQL